MKIPLSYSYRNLVTRRLTTALTAGGMALVVFVFAAVLMLAEGLRQTLVATGSYDNAIVLRASAESEVQSILDRDQAAIVMSQPEIALNKNGNPLVDRELIVLFNLRKRGTNNPSNVTIRGVSPIGLELRPEVKLAAGRMFRSGSAEIVIGKDIAQRFAGAGLGGNAAFCPAGLDRGRDPGRGQHRLQLGNLGGYRPDAAGLPPADLFHRGLAPAVGRRLQSTETAPGVGPPVDGPGEAGDHFLRGPVQTHG